MAEYCSLPLGVDLGSTRVRIAHVERHRSGAVRLRAVASRNLPDPGEGTARPDDLTAAIIEEMLRELGVRERRCVLAIGAPNAALRVVAMPKMSRVERVRAARFEATRFVPWDMDAESTVVRAHPIDRFGERYAIGAARRTVIDDMTRVAGMARLAPVAIDHDSLVFGRIFPDAEAVLDIGSARSTLHAFAGGSALSWHAQVGGNDVTHAIARDLTIDAAAAERRKRILGAAGAGQHAISDVVTRLADLVESARRRVSLTRLLITGNGARLPELARLLERACGSTVELPVAEILRGEAYPDDVVRSAAPDWTLAAGLALHGAAN